MRGGQGAVAIAEHSVIQRVIGWGPAVLWAAVLFLLSEWDSPGFSLDSGLDKVVHGGLYLVLGFTLAWGKWRTAARARSAVLILVGVAYGLADEWHQTLVPGRDASLGDAVADAFGVLLGFTVFMWLAARYGWVGAAPDEPTITTTTRE